MEALRGATFGGTPNTGLEAIRFAGSNRLLVEFDYADKRGSVERRRVEPYSLRSSGDGGVDN